METRQRNVFKESWKYNLSQGTDTLPLQIESLKSFLADIGYGFDLDWVSGVCHIRKARGIKSDNPKFISLKVAVSLYNGYNINTNGTIWEYQDLTFGYKLLRKAWVNKMITYVSLQRHKGEWKVQNRWVQFNSLIVEESY